MQETEIPTFCLCYMCTEEQYVLKLLTSFQREGKNSNFQLCDSEAFRNRKRKNDSTERRSLLIYGLYESCV